MLYLILAIASSACVSIFMRLCDKHIQNNMVMFVANYAICAVLAWVFTGKVMPFSSGEGASFALILGIISGVMYLLSFVLMQWNIKHNGVVLSSTFMKLGVLVPTLMAIVVFREQVKILQIIGFLLAVAAIIMIHFEKTDSEKGKQKIWLIVLLLAGGFTDSLANIYDKTGAASLKDSYLLITFLMAMLCAAFMAVVKKQKPTLKDIGSGLLIGIPNYFSARFLLMALGSVPAVITYPVYSTATMIVISMAGFFFFKEKATVKKGIALGVIVLALVLLNI